MNNNVGRKVFAGLAVASPVVASIVGVLAGRRRAVMGGSALGFATSPTVTIQDTPSPAGRRVALLKVVPLSADGGIDVAHIVSVGPPGFGTAAQSRRPNRHGADFYLPPRRWEVRIDGTYAVTLTLVLQHDYVVYVQDVSCVGCSPTVRIG